MRSERIYGIALVASVAGMLAVAATHPSGRLDLASAEALASFQRVTIAVHALAIFSTGLALFGFTGFSRRLGIDRPDVTAVLVAYAIAVVGVIGAASVSGFVAPALAGAYFEATAEARPALRPFFSYNHMLNQAFANLHVVAACLAILAWSAALLRTRSFGRALAWAGCLLAIGPAVALLAGVMRMDVHGLMVVVLAQGAWTAWVGISMARAVAPESGLGA